MATKAAVGAVLTAILICTRIGLAHAWGDEGHEVVALIADDYLQPAVRQRVRALLVTDSSGLVAGADIAHEATWADKYRDSDRRTTKLRYNATRNWHFVDLELDDPNVDKACIDHLSRTVAMPASQGPARNCVVRKIDEFRAELANRAADLSERRLALQFLLHLVGDLHQPLHASDNHDEGGNNKHVSAPGIRANSLHHYWDTEFVLQLGNDPAQVAAQLAAKITPAQLATWSRGEPIDWAMQSFSLAREQVYSRLPLPDARGSYRLTSTYIDSATKAVATQLSRAGVRLALILNAALK